MSDYEAPGSPQQITIRPLVKGVIRNQSPALLPSGGLFDVMEYIPTQEGLARRGAVQEAFGGTVTIEDAPIRRTFNFFKTSGVIETIAIGRKFLWKVEDTGATRIDYAYEDEEENPDLVAIDGSGNVTWTDSTGALDPVNIPMDQITVGDYIEIDGNEYEILTINPMAYTATVADTVDFPIAATDEFVVHIGLAPGETYDVDYDMGPDALVVVDGYHAPSFIYDGTDFRPLDMTVPFSAGTVHFSLNRFWFGDLIASTTYDRQAILWTEVIATATWEDVPETNYVELPYTSSRILKITSQGEMLLVLFRDMVFYGTVSNDPNLPYYFRRVDTAGIGLAGKRAVTSAEDAVYFFGPDNIWAVAAEGIGRIGDPVLPLFKPYLSGLEFAYVESYAKESLIFFSVPHTTGDGFAFILVLNTVTKAWGRIRINGDSFYSMGVNNPLEIDELSDDYSTGTVSGVDEGTALTGSGTGWVAAGVEAGWVVEIGTSAGTIDYAGERFTIESVDSDTGITLSDALDDDYIDAAYVIVKPISSLTNATDDYDYESEGKKALYFWRREVDGVTSTLCRFYDDLEMDMNEYSVEAMFETGNIDLNYPDQMKTFTSIGMKLKAPVPEGLQFIVTSSPNDGITWRNIGVLTIPAYRAEGRLNFRYTGSALRFRLLEQNGTEPYVIVELTFRAKLRGREARYF